MPKHVCRTHRRHFARLHGSIACCNEEGSYPSEKVREKVFPDGSRSDVLLIDRNEVPVVVECKQGTPTVENVNQLRGYMKHVRDATGKNPRGILIHGGARKLREDVRREVNQETHIDVVQYALAVGFVPCR